MSWEEIFQPGLRHWKEYQDTLADKIVDAPAPGPGPDDVTVDLDHCVVTLPRQAREDVDQGGEEDGAEEVGQEGVPQGDPPHGGGA